MMRGMNGHVARALHAAANNRRGRLCGATDGTHGRCNRPAGHAGEWGWHAEVRKGRLWASWRGPSPGTRCGTCGKDGRDH
jgi:hypothetical protein